MTSGSGERRRMRMTAVRLPGTLGVVLAIPALFVAGAVAVASLAVGLATLVLAPALLRRTSTRDGGADNGATITLDRSAYRTVERDTPRGRERPRLIVSADVRPRR